VSYPQYLGVIEKEQRIKEEQKTTKVKAKLFALYAVAGNVGSLLGPGLFTDVLLVLQCLCVRNRCAFAKY